MTIGIVAGAWIHKFQRYGRSELIFGGVVDNKPDTSNAIVKSFVLPSQLFNISIRLMLRDRISSWWCNYGGSRNRHSRNLPNQAGFEVCLSETRQHPDTRKLSEHCLYHQSWCLVNVKLAFDISVARLNTIQYAARGTSVLAGEMLPATFGDAQ
jgi:hypothetical protein